MTGEEQGRPTARSGDLSAATNDTPTQDERRQMKTMKPKQESEETKQEKDDKKKNSVPDYK